MDVKLGRRPLARMLRVTLEALPATIYAHRASLHVLGVGGAVDIAYEEG